MIALASPHAHRANALPAPPLVEDTLAEAFLPDAVSSALSDHALAVLARTAADWFTPSVAKYLGVRTGHGRIRLAGHIADARPLAYLKTALLRLPGVSGLDLLITVEPPSGLPLDDAATARRSLAG
jgi:hypothetical protein